MCILFVTGSKWQSRGLLSTIDVRFPGMRTFWKPSNSPCEMYHQQSVTHIDETGKLCLLPKPHSTGASVSSEFHETERVSGASLQFNFTRKIV